MERNKILNSEGGSVQNGNWTDDSISVRCIVCGAETDSNGLCVVRKSLEI